MSATNEDEDLSEWSEKQADFLQVLDEALENENDKMENENDKRTGEVCGGFTTPVTCNTIDPKDQGNNRDCEWNYEANQCETNPVAELVKLFRRKLKDDKTITVKDVKFPASQLECLIDVHRAIMDEDLEDFLRQMYFTDEEIFGGAIDAYCRKVFKVNSPNEVFQKLQDALTKTFSIEIVEELESHAKEADAEWVNAQLDQEKRRTPGLTANAKAFGKQALAFVKEHAKKAANYLSSFSKSSDKK